jgi:hypothetical protein
MARLLASMLLILTLILIVPPSALAETGLETAQKALAEELKGAPDCISKANKDLIIAKPLSQALPDMTTDTDLSNAGDEEIRQLADVARLLSKSEYAKKGLEKLIKDWDKGGCLETKQKALEEKIKALVKEKDGAGVSDQDKATAETKIKEAKEVVEQVKSLLAQVTEVIGVDATRLRAKTLNLKKYMGAIAKALKKRLEDTKLTTLTGDRVDNRALLYMNLPALGTIAEQHDTFMTNTDSVLEALKDALEGVTTEASDKAIEELATAKTTIYEKIPEAFKAVVADFTTRGTKITETITAIEKGTTPDQRRDKALEAITLTNEAQQAIAEVNVIVSAFNALPKSWKKDSADGLDASRKALNAKTALLTDALAGDQSKFVQDQVRLYYFTDVRRLMKALNDQAEIVNKEALAYQKQAEKVRRDLLDTEGDLAAKLAAVSLIQTQILGIQEQIRQANAAVTRDTQHATQATNLLNTLKAQNVALGKSKDILVAQNKTLDTKIAAATGATKEQLQAQKEENLKTIATIDEQRSAQADKITAQTATETAAKNAKDASLAEQQRVAGEQAALPTRKTEAVTNLINAQIEVQRLRRVAARLAQEEAEAFAAGRDNAGYWFAPANFTSSDPAKRVKIYGYDDSKTLYIRGMVQDVEEVKEIIAGFDQPAPQARISLYTLQMNGKPNQINGAMGNIDRILRSLRSNISTVQDLLRNSINKEVNRVAEIAQSANPEFSGRMARYFYYPTEFRQQLGFLATIPDLQKNQASLNYDIKQLKAYLSAAQEHNLLAMQASREKTQNTARAQRNANLRKAAIYWEYLNQNPVFTQNLSQNSTFSNIAGRLQALYRRQATDEEFKEGFNSIDAPLKTMNALEVEELSADCKMGIPALNASSYLTRWTLPDPANGTTLGEMLFVLSLGSHDSRERILQYFAAEFEETVYDERKIDISPDILNKPINLFTTLDFPRTLLGAIRGDKSEHELTSNQKEILSAIKARTQEAVAAEIRILLRQINSLSTPTSNAAVKFREQYLPLVGYLSMNATHYAPSQSTPLVKDWACKGLEFLKPLANQVVDRPNQLGVEHDRLVWTLAELTGQRNSLSRSTPRVAAADDMIKRLIIMAENDFEKLFIDYALQNIRKSILREGGQLGTLQKESLLVTNRLVARMDPSANISTTLGSETDFLQSAMQLGQLTSKFIEEQRNLKLNSGLPAAAIAGVSKMAGASDMTMLNIGGIVGLLSSLAAESRTPPGEIYSINSGNLFKVTPIFDPSGQALRFKFDYAQTVRVQEPNGTTNTQIPRVERHTMNTEVQLSNLEFREISRFESNTKLGLPEFRSGGIPLLKEIPLIKEIPIIGYFYRKGGNAAVSQQSLIFAQTSLYPTVADITNLLVEVPRRSDLDRSIPRYLSSKPPPVPLGPKGDKGDKGDKGEPGDKSATGSIEIKPVTVQVKVEDVKVKVKVEPVKVDMVIRRTPVKPCPPQNKKPTQSGKAKTGQKVTNPKTNKP